MEAPGLVVRQNVNTVEEALAFVREALAAGYSQVFLPSAMFDAVRAGTEKRKDGEGPAGREVTVYPEPYLQKGKAVATCAVVAR